MITQEFEIDESTQSFNRSDDGRIVGPPPPIVPPEPAAPVLNAEDWDPASPYLPVDPTEEPVVRSVLEEYWRELLTVGLGTLVVLVLMVAFITRSRDGDGGDGARIESIGNLQTVTPLDQQQPTERPTIEGAAADGRNQSSGTFVDGAGPGDDRSDGSEPDESATETTGVETTVTTVPTTPPTLPSTTTTTTTAPPVTVIDADDVGLVNGGFDDVRIEPGGFQIVSSIGGWQSQTGEFEIWHKEHDEDIDSKDGDYFLELNANGQGLIYQDFATVPNSRIRWQLQHRGRQGRESVEILIGAPNGQYESVDVISSGNRRWREYRGNFVVPPGQTVTRIIIRSLEPGSAGNFLDEVRVETADVFDDD